MDSNSSQKEELYRAAVGESKAGYYVPLFHRFDQGGSRVSWNWPAFFATFFWLLYRRMYGLAFGYLLLLPVALAMIAGAVSAATGPIYGALSYWTLALAVQLAIAPMFANAIYHWHVRNRINALTIRAPSQDALLQQVARPGATGNVGVIIGVAAFFGLGILGILAAIAIPAYQDYTIRSQVTEGLVAAARVKASLAEAYAKNGQWPAELQGIGPQDSARYVSSIDVSEGVILVSYGKAAHRLIAGHTLSLHPSVEGDQVVEWVCGYAAGEAAQTDIAPKYLPTNCRPPKTERL